MSSLRSNIFSVLILQGSNYLIPLITLPYLARALGVSGYGIFTLVFGIVGYLILFVDFGFNLASTKEIATHKDDPHYVNKIFWATTGCKLVLLFLALVAAYLVSFIYDHIPNIRYLLSIALLMLLSTVLLPVFLFQGLGQMKSVTVSQVIGRFLGVPLIFLFVNTPEDIDIAVWIQAGSFCIASIIAVFYIGKHRLVSVPLWDYREIKAIFVAATPFFLGNMAISLYTMSTPIIMGVVSNTHELGLFSVAIRILGVVTGLFSSLNSALFPHASKVIEEDRGRYYQLIRKIVYIETPLALMCIVGVVITSSFVIALLFGEKYQGVESVLFILLPIMLLSPLSVALSNYILVPMGHRDLYYKIPFITALCHLSYTVFLVQWLGAVGGAISLLMTEMVSFGLLFFCCYQKNYIRDIFIHKG